MRGTRLEGLRVLVVEDEAAVSMLIEDTLAELGCEVAGVAARLEAATKTAGSLAFDVALLDVNLRGQKTESVVAVLSSRRIPFVVVTGYGALGVPDSFRGAPILAKPFRKSDLERALAAALASADKT